MTQQQQQYLACTSSDWVPVCTRSKCSFKGGTTGPATILDTGGRLRNTRTFCDERVDSSPSFYTGAALPVRLRAQQKQKYQLGNDCLFAVQLEPRELHRLLGREGGRAPSTEGQQHISLQYTPKPTCSCFRLLQQLYLHTEELALIAVFALFSFAPLTGGD